MVHICLYILMKITFRNPTQQYFPTPSHVTHNGVTFLWKMLTYFLTSAAKLKRNSFYKKQYFTHMNISSIIITKVAY